MGPLINNTFIAGIVATGMLFTCRLALAENTTLLLADNESNIISSVIAKEIMHEMPHDSSDLLLIPQESLQEGHRINLFNAIPSSIAIHWGNPSGKKLKILTALDCPYCAKQQTILKKLEDVHIEEYIVPQVDTYGRVDLKSAAVWCNNNRLSALNRAFSGELIPVFDECNTTSLLAVVDFIKKYHLPVTPAFIKENGQVHTGYLTKRQLTQWLKEN